MGIPGMVGPTKLSAVDWNKYTANTPIEGGTTAYLYQDEPPRGVGGNARDRRKRRRLVARILRGDHRRRR